jgi:Ser/Thr protein kinase RdoA (MazF antagonist)
MSRSPAQLPLEAIERALAEFDLGGLLAVRALDGGISVPFYVATEAGQFVLHPDGETREVDLYRDVERALNRAGVRQPSVTETSDGRLVSSRGWVAQEYIAGAWVLRPSVEQSREFAAYLARYHAALAAVPIPGWLRVADSAWRRADALDLALGELREETIASEPIEAVRDAYDRCAERILQGNAYLDALPQQLFHGDASSENILWGDGGPVLIDFTPYAGHHLTALAISQYWHHVYFNDQAIDLDRVLGEIEAYGEAWAGASLELGAFPLLLVRVALRQLAQLRTRSAEGEAFSSDDRERLARCAEAILDAEPELAQRLAVR